jgi:hypothetical protein
LLPLGYRVAPFQGECHFDGTRMSTRPGCVSSLRLTSSCLAEFILVSREACEGSDRPHSNPRSAHGNADNAVRNGPAAEGRRRRDKPPPAILPPVLPLPAQPVPGHSYSSLPLYAEQHSAHAGLTRGGFQLVTQMPVPSSPAGAYVAKAAWLACRNQRLMIT